MKRKLTTLRVPSYKIPEYYNDVSKVMTAREIAEVCAVTPQTVHYACRMGYLMNFGDNNIGLYSTANVFDWVGKKYGQEALQRAISAWYAYSALKRDEQTRQHNKR